MTRSIVTVTTASDTFDLTTLDTVKAELQITDESKDDLLRRYIRAESDRMARYCKRVLAIETVSEEFRTDTRRECLMLDRYPVTAIASVVEDGVTLATAAYQVKKASGLIYRLSDDGKRSEWAMGKITVAYTGGYELLGTLPLGIQEACIEMVTGRWMARGRDPMLKLTEVEGMGRREYWVGSTGDDDGLPTSVAAALQPYRRIAL